MIIASGVVEIYRSENLNRILSELKTRGVAIDDVDGDTVRFQIERKTMAAVKTEMDALRRLDEVRNVHITYYSLEDAGDDHEF